MRRPALTAALLLLALGAGALMAWWAARDRYERPGPLPAPAAVVVPRGTPAQLGDALQAAGVVADPLAFRLAAMATAREGTLRAGEFAFPAHASLRAVLGVLRTGRPVQHHVTIPEGLTAAQIAQLLARDGLLSGEVAVPAEGAVLPQTYAFERGAPAASVLERAETAMTRTLAQEWDGRTADLPLSSPQEMLTLASIVERETARPEERPMVAAVFLNRLRKGMKLQSDPTVAYAVTGGAGTLERALTRADLEFANPYNTYRTAGLPPGPIGSPGVAALRAVAHPARIEDLYFVADGNGGHMFARTLDEHNRNVTRWRETR